MYSQNNDVVARVNEKDGRISFRFPESKILVSATDNIIPFSSSLFEAIEGFE
jgi:hypothetical protein